MPQDKAKTYAKVLVETLEDASESEAKKKVQRFKLMLQKRGDAKYASEILREFAKAWKERKGPIATVVSAESLAPAVRKEMEQSLAKSAIGGSASGGKKYVVEEKVDKSVIGGIAVLLGNNFLIDGTIRGKLKRISALLNK
ncbi:MAG: F0F1 ATP synthase subunit delta [Candidatus Wildermuthbacteria bacterium]|nr:F0F1 ATP synthase subunit delta [Candidatus Wildermuthbacteria bacterium]